VDLETGDEIKMALIVRRGPLNDPANDRKNAVTVTAEALANSEKVAFKNAADEISSIFVEDRAISNGSANSFTCGIKVKNDGKTRLTNIVLTDTLPDNMKYDRSMRTSIIRRSAFSERFYLNVFD